MPSLLADPDSSVEVLQWGDSTRVIHGGKEGEWLSVDNEEFFIDTEDAL